MPHFPMNSGTLVRQTAAMNLKEPMFGELQPQETSQSQLQTHLQSQLQLRSLPPTQQSDKPAEHPPASVQVKNRRKRYLDVHPEYFGPDLEISDPLLYDRLIRRFQTPEEREAEGRSKGHSGVLEADLVRSELKMEALAHPDANAIFTYSRGPNGEIKAEDQDEIPESKEEGLERWRWEMEMRFLKGADHDFDYSAVDECDDYDDWNEEQEKYFENEEPEWFAGKDELQGETGVQDF